MIKTYLPYEPDQQLLLPAALQEWLPDDHLAYFISDVVDQLDMSKVTARYERERRGGPPYHPRMMVKVLLYGYCVGVASSRRIAQRLHEDIAFRVLAANNTPDFRTISDFRKDNVDALSSLFVQVLALCQQAGLVKLGHVALDGTKVKANASKHKAMSYQRIKEKAAQLAMEVAELLQQAQAGHFHNCGVTTGAAAYCWGFGRAGRLGNGLTVDQATPVAVSGGLTFASVSAGSNHTYGVTTGGSAYCWGWGGAGEGGKLGDGSGKHQFTPAAVAPPAGGISTPTPQPTLNPTPTQVPVPGDNYDNALAIELDEAASFSITLGSSHFYEVQLEEGITYTIYVSLDNLEYSVVTLTDSQGGTLDYKISFPGSDAGIIVWTATRSGSYFVDVTALRDSGSYALTVTEGDIPRPPPIQLPTATPIPTATPSAAPSPSAAALTFTAVSAGNNHTCGVTTSGTAYCWGLGLTGVLGNGSTDVQTTPVAVSGGLSFTSVSAGSEHTCGVTTGGAAYCWGWGDDGRLGNGSTDDQTTPVAVSGGLAFASVSAGGSQSCGVTTSGTAYCWGLGRTGVLGNGLWDTQTRPVAVSGGLTFAAVSAGHHTCGVTTGSASYCWGGAQAAPVAVQGELTFAAVSPSNGGLHHCSVTTSGAAYCWGRGNDGQLGNGSTDGQFQPQAVSGGLAFASVSPGATHTCGLTTSGGAHCWGQGSNGRLGNGSTDFQTTPVAVLGGLTFASVSAGRFHTCGVTTSGAAYCWGSGNSGRLGNGSTDEQTTPVAVGPPVGGQ